MALYPCGPLKSLGRQWVAVGAGLDTPLLWHVLLQLQRLPTTSWLPAEKVLKGLSLVPRAARKLAWFMEVTYVVCCVLYDV